MRKLWPPSSSITPMRSRRMPISSPSASPNWDASRTSIPKAWRRAAIRNTSLAIRCRTWFARTLAPSASRWSPNTEIIRYLGDDDPTTRIAMEQIMAKEEEHADDMKKLLDTLSKDERLADHA